MKGTLVFIAVLGCALAAAGLPPWTKDAPSGAAPEASDPVLVRRAWLDLAGFVPAAADARAYVAATNADKFAALVDALLFSDDFATFWSMRFGDELRIKSEFPINLWPDACFLYTRHIHGFLSNNEPYDRFARGLLLAQGSDFRVGAANFYRAVAVRDADHLADAVSRFFLGRPLAGLPPAARRDLPEFFRGVHYKTTKEWKEEIVYLEPPGHALLLVLPDGSTARIPVGSDPRAAFADWLTAGKGRPLFAAAIVARVHRWIFAAEPPPETAAALADSFLESGCDFRALVRSICLSPAYKSPSIPSTSSATSALFPVHRLGAEQLADSIDRVTGTTFKYESVIPEPFSCYPGAERAAALPDGSVTDSFLLLFGRPSRDAGLPSERDDMINAKRRLALANSADLFRRLRNLRPAGKTQDDKVASLYWAFYSRPPTKKELATARDFFKAEKGRQPQVHFAWLLLNSKEFLYQH